MTYLIASITVLSDVGRGLREGFFMFWETLWALVLGFTLSGVVQAFVPKEKMLAKLGDHSPPIDPARFGLRHGLVQLLLRRLGHV